MTSISTRILPCKRCGREGRTKLAVDDGAGSVDWYCKTGNPSCHEIHTGTQRVR